MEQNLTFFVEFVSGVSHSHQKSHASHCTVSDCDIKLLAFEAKIDLNGEKGCNRVWPF